MTGADIDTLLAGGPAALVLMLLVRGTLRLAREWDEMRRDRDMWRRIALEGNDVAKRAVEIAELAADER